MCDETEGDDDLLSEGAGRTAAGALLPSNNRKEGGAGKRLSLEDLQVHCKGSGAAGMMPVSKAAVLPCAALLVHCSCSVPCLPQPVGQRVELALQCWLCGTSRLPATAPGCTMRLAYLCCARCPPPFA